MASNIPLISPNPVTNGYHLWSPASRGYGAHSSAQLIQVDLLKTKLGNNFDYTQCIDSDRFLDPQKLDAYAKKNGLDFNKPNNLNLEHY